eukprot:6370488-Amphidinium_carterae.1
MQGIFPDTPTSLGDPSLVATSFHGADVENDPRSWLGLTQLDDADSGEESSSDSEQESRPVLPTVVHFHPTAVPSVGSLVGKAFPRLPARGGHLGEGGEEQHNPEANPLQASDDTAGRGFIEEDETDSESDEEMDTRL